MPVTALVIQYDGGGFFGFQKQKIIPSVQQTLETALSTILKEKIKITGAGRTDTGVHAWGMVVSFEHTNEIVNYHKLITSINALSAQGVNVLSGSIMPPKFNARFSCTEREYEYWILNTKYPYPLFSGRATWIHVPLYIELLEGQFKDILGRNNFKSFAKASSVKEKPTEREITSVSISRSKEWEGIIKINIRGSGFLHNMIRILVGSAIQVSLGKTKMGLKEIIEKENRSSAGITLPPYGLYFKRAYYQDYPQINSLYHSEVLSK